MTAKIKLRKTGDSIGTIFPKEVLHSLRVGEGDTLHAVETPQGVLLTHDPEFATMMDIADKIIDRDGEAFKELATK